MKLLLDMNLSPTWLSHLEQSGFTATHWAHVGDPRASDAVILDWVRTHGCVLVTHDLDFARLIALTNLRGPSVVLLRVRDLLPEALTQRLESTLRACDEMLREGSLVVLDEAGWRVRALPIRRDV